MSPNCVTKVVSYNDSPRLILVANTFIKEDIELLFDYGRNWLKLTYHYTRKGGLWGKGFESPDSEANCTATEHISSI